jgi:glutamate-ammonia-ligase adenylyltransferase
VAEPQVAAAFADERLAARDREALAALAPAGEVEAAVRACLASSAPDGALAALAGIVAARARLGRAPRLDPSFLARLVPTLAGSRFLARAMAAAPRLADHLRATPWFTRGKPPELVRAELARAVARVAPGDEARFHAALRRIRTRELLRIAARDLAGGASLADVGEELSALAAAALDVALERIVLEVSALHGAPAGEARRGGGLAVLGMGKLGAGELNFSSDIDLILVYAVDGETRGGPGGALTHRQFHARVAERLARALGAVTADGFVFRVDLNLRPGGRSGPIVESFDGFLRYYEAQGRTWERAAMLRARPVAGDLALGDELLRALAPFVFRRSIDFAAVEEIRAMKARIDREASAGERDLKLGPGGIREVEFVVAALLLLNAGRDPRLRERGTLPALDRLLFSGLLPARDRDALAAAYLLLRRAENRIQARDDRQTQRLPSEPTELGRLALGLGFPGPLDRAAAALEADLAKRRVAVARIFGDLLGAAGAAPRAADPRVGAALDPMAADDERRAALAGLGFAAPDAALAELARLARRPGTPFSLAAPPPGGEAERLLGELSRTPDPDLALAHLAAFASMLSAPGPYFALLAGNPAVARLLLQLFGTSDFLSKYFLRHPELLDSLLGPSSVWTAKGAERLAAQARDRVAARPADDLEGRLAALRRFKNEETLRIGLADVSGTLDLSGVAGELTAVADACLGACLELAAAEALERWGPPGGGATLSVIGLGKLGGRELGYHSDLDLIFLYASGTDGDDTSAGGTRGRLGHAEYFTRLAQRLIAHLQVPLREGSLYQIDTRLRPSGTRGALVVSLAALATYHRREAALWERQALLKARHVAGDAALFERAEREVLAPAIFRHGADPTALGPAIAAMRRRLEAEASGEGRGEKNPKTGYGGLVDIEFAAQYLQLLHGATHPELRTPSTPEAIARLGEAGFLSPADARLLAEAYRYLRRLELRLRIVHDFGISRLPPPGPKLAGLARRLGHGGERGGASLLEEYARTTAAVREAFQRIVGVP